MLYLIRHAESKVNAQEKGQLIIQSLDIPLSKQGEKQARVLAEELKKLKISDIYSSQAVRAQATAEVIARNQGVKVKSIDLINEMGQKETFKDLRDRAERFLDEVDIKKGYDVIVIAHAVILKMLVACAIFKSVLTPEFFVFFGHIRTRNTGITILDKKSDGSWDMLTWNNFSHLN